MRLRLLRIAGEDRQVFDRLREVLWLEYERHDRPYGVTEEAMLAWSEAQLLQSRRMKK